MAFPNENKTAIGKDGLDITAGNAKKQVSYTASPYLYTFGAGLWLIDEDFTYPYITQGAPPPLPTPSASVLTPLNGATGVLANAVVSALFNMDVTVVNLSGVTIVGANEGTIGGVVATLGLDNRTVTITHNDFMGLGELYTVTIPAMAVESLDDVANEEITWTFTTWTPNPFPNENNTATGKDGLNISGFNAKKEVSYIASPYLYAFKAVSYASWDIEEDVTYPFLPYIATVTTRGLKVWNGSAWVEHSLNRWNGSAWVTHGIKYFNGIEYL